MSSKNDITGDYIISKQTNDNYRNGWDKIFNKDNNKENIEEIQKEKLNNAK